MSLALALLFWLQSRPLSKTVIAIAGLLFVLAIVAVVYFVRKLRSSSKSDDDWSMTRSSLFVERPQAASDVATDAATDLGATDTNAADPHESVETGPDHTRLLASDGVNAEPRLN